MAVDDHGLEVLKKAGLDISGNKSNYALQVLISGLVSAITTELTRVRLQGESIYRVQDGVLVRTVFGTNLNIRILDGGQTIVKVS